ncbi:MAG TPA: hypothetical protein PLP27_06455 [Crocinitomicaceae bacterium]|nr:hypothetical protein [Crocinitomicaceae bacterium]
MNLKLKSRQELNVLYHAISSNYENLRFITDTEKILCFAILKDFGLKLVKKQYAMTCKSIKLTMAEAFMLRIVLVQIKTGNAYNDAVLSTMYFDIDKFCTGL